LLFIRAQCQEDGSDDGVKNFDIFCHLFYKNTENFDITKFEVRLMSLTSLGVKCYTYFPSSVLWVTTTCRTEGLPGLPTDRTDGDAAEFGHVNTWLTSVVSDSCWHSVCLWF